MSDTEHDAPILRTSTRRMVKMLIIIIGIQIVGGALFFSHYDFWNSYLPIAGKLQEQGEAKSAAQGTATGKEIDVSLSFVESPDFKNYGFDAPFGTAGANPEVDSVVGDKIVFSVKNAGKSFHAFGVTDSKTGPGPVIEGTGIGSADNPMKPGADGKVTFVPAKAGEYYYICAVPGHREMGMEGKIEVKEASSGSIVSSSAAVTPTGNKVEFSLSFVMSTDFKDYAFNALAGQPGHNPDIKVKSGDTVTIHIKNDSKSFHSFGVVTDPEDPTNILWNSAFKSADNPMKPGESGDVTFVAGAAGTYHYICTVPGHAALGMSGNFIVEK